MSAIRQHLLEAARTARLNACAGYSHFPVGAALLSADGAIVHGLQRRERHLRADDLCRARGVVQGAFRKAHRRFTHIAVVADTADPTPPCGACRQLLWEYGGDLEIILGNLDAEKGIHRLRALFPLPFDNRLLP